MKSILIISEDPIIYLGIESFIKNIFSAQLVHDRYNTIEERLNDKYDLVILDVDGLNESRAMHYLSSILKLHPKQKTLIISDGSELVFEKMYLQDGAYGYIRKKNLAENIAVALNCIFSEIPYLSPLLASNIKEKFLGKNVENPFFSLGKREMEICLFLLNGLTQTDICRRLNLHASTISTHKLHLFKKLNITSIIELIELARYYELNNMHRYST